MIPNISKIASAIEILFLSKTKLSIFYFLI